MDRDQARTLLRESIEKQNDLKDEKETWDRDLPNRCPPVLWFGESTGGGPAVVTVAANPSHKEYLKASRNELASVNTSAEHSSLEPVTERRLHVPDHRMKDLREDDAELEGILDGYDAYFERNPYTRWFGKDAEDSYCVEGFLRGFGASYYDGTGREKAVHIDLVPFCTLRSFGDIEQRVEADLFEESGPDGERWAPDFLEELVELLDPEILIVFGETTVRHFERHFDKSLHGTSWKSCPKQPACYKMDYSGTLDRPIIRLGTNLGNPMGFDKKSLRDYGTCVRSVYDAKYGG